MAVDTQLPTPPEESRPELQFETGGAYSNTIFPRRRDPWHGQSVGDSSGISPPLEGYEIQDDELLHHQYEFPDLSSKASPSSSNEALPDQDEENLENTNKPPLALFQLLHTAAIHGRRMSVGSMEYGSPEVASTSSSTSLSSMHPLDDGNTEPVLKDLPDPVLKEQLATGDGD